MAARTSATTSRLIMARSSMGNASPAHESLSTSDDTAGKWRNSAFGSGIDVSGGRRDRAVDCRLVSLQRKFLAAQPTQPRHHV